MVDPLTAATGVAGLLSLTIQVSQMLHKQLQTMKDAPSDAKELLDELQTLHQVLTSLQVFLSTPAVQRRLQFKGTSALVNAIEGCKTKIDVLKLKFEKLTKGKGLARVIERGKWYYDHNEHRQIIATLHRYLG